EDPLFSPEKCWREMADLGDERGRFAETSNHELHRRLPAPCVSPGRGNCLHCGGPAEWTARILFSGFQDRWITAASHHLRPRQFLAGNGSARWTRARFRFLSFAGHRGGAEDAIALYLAAGRRSPGSASLRTPFFR